MDSNFDLTGTQIVQNTFNQALEQTVCNGMNQSKATWL